MRLDEPLLYIPQARLFGIDWFAGWGQEYLPCEAGSRYDGFFPPCLGIVPVHHHEVPVMEDPKHPWCCGWGCWLENFLSFGWKLIHVRDQGFKLKLTGCNQIRFINGSWHSWWCIILSGKQKILNSVSFSACNLVTQNFGKVLSLYRNTKEQCQPLFSLLWCSTCWPVLLHDIQVER